MPQVSDFPGLSKYLNTQASETLVEQQVEHGQTYLRVTQLFEDAEGLQSLFSLDNGKLTLLQTDNNVEFPTAEFRQLMSPGFNGIMSDAEHAAVAAEAIASVDVFKTGDGPEHGSTACLWACRRVVHQATGKWITQSDGTATFYTELKNGHMNPAAADSLPPGALIISPTSSAAVGHIGVLGTGSGRSRLVYSNHSPNRRDPVARWEQNYDVGRFTDYHQKLGLPTLFFALPNPGAALIN